MAAKPSQEPERRNGNLSIPLPFEEALKAALEVQPPEGVEKAKKARVVARAKKKPKSA
jgi:hypothetical protein